MKKSQMTTQLRSVIRCLSLVAAMAIMSAGTAQAANTIKLDNADALNLTSSWNNGLPGWGIWTGTYTPANCTNSMGATAFWSGLTISNVTGAPINITGSSPTLGLTGNGGGGGVVLDMSAATVDLTIACAMSLNQNVAATPMIFTNGSGRTFAMTAASFFGHGNASTLVLDGAGNYLFSAQISQLGTLSKKGSGTLTLSNNIGTYITNVTLNAGKVNLNKTFCINGNANTAFVINGGTVDNTSGATIALTANPPISFWNGDFTFAGTTNLNLGGGAVTLGGNRQITCNANTLTVGGVIGDGGAGYSLTKSGSGTLSLSGASSYTGNTVISNGTLALGGSASLSSSRILVGNGGTLNVSVAGWSGNGSQSLGGASTSGTGTITNGAQTITLNGGDGLAFQAAGGSSHTVGNVNVAGATGSLNLNNNTVTINVSGFALGASTNTLLTVTGTLNGSANPAPTFAGLALSNGYAAEVITISGSAGSILLVVTNVPQVGETTTTTVARTTGTSSEIYGSQLDFTATVSGTATSPTGNVIFKDGATIIATVALNPGADPISTATYTEYTDLKVAGSPHSITAYYQGDGTHNLSDSSGTPVAQTITAKPLDYSGLTAGSAIYDGTTTAKLGGAAALQTAEAPGSGTTADRIPYTVDSAALGGSAAGTLTAKDVGNQSVTITGVTLTGAGAGNYTVLQQTGLVQNVTAKALTVVGLTVTNKVYDGTATAGFTTNSLAVLQAAEAAGAGATIDGKPYTGDSVSLTGTPVGTFAQTNAADNIAVTVTGLSLTGADTNNYTLTAPVFTASIVGPPGDQIRADNSGYTLITGYAWVSGFQPDGTNWAIWTGSYQPANLTASLGGSVAWGGIMLSNVTGGPVVIQGNNILALNAVTSGGGGINLVGVNDLTLDLARLNLKTNSSWNVASGSTFTWEALTSPFAFNLNDFTGSHNLTLNGGGDYIFLGNLYDDPGNAILTFNGTGSYTLGAANYVTKYKLNSGTLTLGNTAAVRGSVTL
ncbi:MAG: YDG domain-containing protein, partial [Verrucomicrobiota bacterium]